MSKINRKLFATFIQAKGTTPTYEIIGTDSEEFLVEMAANVVKTANILGESSITIDRYEKSSSLEVYKADDGSEVFKWLQDIVDEEKTLGDLNTNVVHVKLWETPTEGAYPAYKEDVVVEVVSYGGNTEGYQIPYNIHYTGKRTAGTFNPSTKTFTAAE